MKTLIIDDDIALCELVAQTMAATGVEMETENTADSGVQRVLEENFDVVILDVMIGTDNGFDVLQRIRMTSDVPIIMLTAKGDWHDRVRGLDLGADDYVPKPFRPEELLARMKAVTRRTNRSEATGTIQLGSLALHPSRNEVDVGDQTIALTGVETVILRMLMSRAGGPVSREHLYKTVLNRSPSPFDRSLDNHVSNLRRKLGPTATGSHRILSVRGIGYQFAL